MLKSIEKWAAASPERERLLVILICAGLGVCVLLTITLAAVVMTTAPQPPS